MAQLKITLVGRLQCRGETYMCENLNPKHSLVSLLVIPPLIHCSTPPPLPLSLTILGDQGCMYLGTANLQSGQYSYNNPHATLAGLWARDFLVTFNISNINWGQY